MFLWSSHISSRCASFLTQVPKKSVIQYFTYFRDICSWKILQDINNFIFGGPGHVIQIDESLICKRKFGVVHSVLERWVLGIYDTFFKRGVFIFVVRRNRQTLYPSSGTTFCRVVLFIQMYGVHTETLIR